MFTPSFASEYDEDTALDSQKNRGMIGKIMIGKTFIVGLPILFAILIFCLILLFPVYMFSLPAIYDSINNSNLSYGNAESSGAMAYKIGENANFRSPLGVSKLNISSGYGTRVHPITGKTTQHDGIDIACDEGTEIRAVMAGKVKLARNVDGYGNFIEIDHGNGLETCYAHLSQIIVKEGENVKKDSLIAYSGNTGASTGAHLHFEVRQNAIPQDPTSYLDLQVDVPDVLPEELKYIEINKDKLRSFLNSRNSMLAGEPYFSAILDVSKKFDVNPLLMFAITGQEQSFVPKDTPNAEKIANNPYNVHHSWYEFNTDITDSATIAAKTVINLSKGRLSTVNPILWINTRGGEGGYAEDSNWWIGVSSIFNMLKNKV